MIRKTVIVLTSIFILTGCTGTMPELGIENGQFKPCPKSPNCVNSQAQDEKHFIEPIRIRATPSKAKSVIVSILNSFDRAENIVIDDKYIKAEFVSKVFRFVDDVEFYIQEDGPEEVIVDVRSASRVGYSDLGVNRKRIELIRSKLQDEDER